MSSFPSIRIEGGMLGPDLLAELVAAELPGQKPADFGLAAGRSLTDEAAAVFADARALWGVFRHRIEKLPESDIGTTLTRDAWVIPFLGLFDYQLGYNPRAFEVDGRTYAVSHRAGESEDAPPVHVVGAGQDLGRVAASGRPRMAPHSLLQEYLNRTEHVWGLVTNGKVLRLLRDCTFVRRQAYVEFDLQAMFEEQRFQDFNALYRLVHRTRLPKGMADAGTCLLEKYYCHSVEQGGRVRERLRDGVEECIGLLANGFLRHSKNADLRRRVSPECKDNERISANDLYRQVLRLVYRFLFLLVSEDRGLLSPDETYRAHYGIARLRRLLENRAAWSDHDDLWQSLRVLWQVLTDEKLAGHLSLAPLNGELFAWQALDDFTITNRDLLDAFWRLTWYDDRRGAPPRRVNYAALDVEELGSVYESLLEFHPTVTIDAAGMPAFNLVFGSERKTTGSYYTPPELVGELVKSALEPVIQDRLASRPKEPEKALLSIRVCDPACGSGHFLLAAARRIGKELARVRTGDEEPAPERVREAIRDVVTHCIYGVDRNPLAVDLCRVALWLESHTGNKPLTFLDHRIRFGDSLVGVFDLEALKNGIPDKAFEPVEGDDRTVGRALVRRNRQEREGQNDLFAWNAAQECGDLTRQCLEMDAIADDTPEAIRKKKQIFEQSHADPKWQRQKTACDLWTAAFFQPLKPETQAVTTAVLAVHLAGRPVDARLTANAEVSARHHRFFHWPLEFPEVFETGGFDVLLSNPPWERIKLQEQEFFAVRDPQIASAPNKAARGRLISALPRTNQALHAEYTAAVHDADALSKFLRQSARFPLTATGDINTYAVFAETIRRLISPTGRAGVIVPSGIATDSTTQSFFRDTVEKRSLLSLYGFDNARCIFPAIHPDTPFCLVTFGPTRESTEFAHYLLEVPHLRDRRRRFTLSAEALALFNPNTKTCPIFRTGADADLTRKIYERVPVLIHEGHEGGNLWAIRFMTMFHMSNDSHLFENAPGKDTIPLYEAKLIHQFDHRFATYEAEDTTRDAKTAEKADTRFQVRPRYWVGESEVSSRLETGSTDRAPRWLLGFRDITNATNERTAIFSFLPRVGVGNNAPLMLPARGEPELQLCLLGGLNSLVFDFCARQKIGGTHMNFFLLQQLPVLPPAFYQSPDVSYVASRVLELVYTADDMEPLAEALRAASSPIASAVPPKPFRWDEARRAVLRAELDAWFARAYGLTRDELRYILDPADVYGPDFPSETFRVLKEKEMAKFGEYRTRRLVLEAWDRLWGK
ncbi:MAG: N-6 DNA methylase [Deltaproteobacteria bacterium]|nr:N-6 DNA methylase [Deltaproteobacteria bacterium]